MSYLVLARKYRPQTFEEIVGQEHVTKTLANAFAKGRVHHAFLFCGARGVGKTTAARVLAKALCCETGPTATPCGTCQACTTITSGTAVDYFEIDGASNNSVDDIRELRDGVRYQPAQLRRKIYVIDEVHMLSTAAFNALLKTLEEPPPHVTFIFATTEAHKIPITILSRCQRYDFKLVSTRRLEAHLRDIVQREGIAIDDGALSLLAREAGGSVRDSLSLADQVIAYAGAEAISEARAAEVLGVADRALLSELVRAVLEHDAGAALEAIDAAVGRGVDVSHLARSFLGALRDLAVAQSVQRADGLIEASADEIARLRELSKTVSRPALMALFDRFARACEDLKESPTPRLVVEIALVDMAGSEPLEPIAELVDRLENLERRLAGGVSAPAPTTPRPSRPTQTPTPTPTPTPAARPPAPESRPPAPRPRAPAGAPDDPMSEWERAITALEKRSITLAGVFSHARLLSWDERAIELGFAAEFQAGLATDKLPELKKFLAEMTGAPLDVRVKTISGLPASGAARGASAAAPPAVAGVGGPISRASDVAERTSTGRSVAEVEDQRRRDQKQAREDEARKHPITTAVLDTFGAEIKEIKTDG